MLRCVTDAYFLPNHETYMIRVIEQCQKQAEKVFRNETCEVSVYQNYLKEKIEHVHQQIATVRRLLENAWLTRESRSSINSQLMNHWLVISVQFAWKMSKREEKWRVSTAMVSTLFVNFVLRNGSPTTTHAPFVGINFNKLNL